MNTKRGFSLSNVRVPVLTWRLSFLRSRVILWITNHMHTQNAGRETEEHTTSQEKSLTRKKEFFLRLSAKWNGRGTIRPRQQRAQQQHKPQTSEKRQTTEKELPNGRRGCGNCVFTGSESNDCTHKQINKTTNTMRDRIAWLHMRYRHMNIRIWQAATQKKTHRTHDEDHRLKASTGRKHDKRKNTINNENSKQTQAHTHTQHTRHRNARKKSHQKSLLG